ncbi:S8 family serine peptidase [uncultured Thiodictyon sp.]|uniref:S8 family serine peptidase n=1 Tax=uncultured Thiodictyon sp. TaxID=1846217 RepID=UPI0025E101D3|nr:S8 family serine peptidase [uncultured Thiodictyon sp.]
MDTLLFDRHPVDTRAGQLNLPSVLASQNNAGAALQVIQFVGPIKQAWLDAVVAAGGTPVQYIANNGYLVWTAAAGRTQLDNMAKARDFVQYSAPHQPAFKLGASIENRILSGANGSEVVPVVIQLYNHPNKKASQDFIAGLTVKRLSDWSPILAFENTMVSVRASDLLSIALLPDVVWIGERFPRHLMDEVQGQIVAGNLDGAGSGPSGPGYQAWLNSLGFSQSPTDYPIVSVADDGVGNGTTINGAGDVTLTALGGGTVSRVAFAKNCTTDASADGAAGHGHINTSIISSYDARTGFPYQYPSAYQRGLGINPYGRTGNTKIFANIGYYDISGCGGTDTSLIKSEHDNGALISSNSWGCDFCAGTYDASSQAYDSGVRDADPSTAGNQPMVYVFSAGNSGPTVDTIGTPGNGKNMITVGASENQRPINEAGNWTDGCGIGPTGANNAMDVIYFSSRGPAPGGRIKPEVIAPGTHIQGTASTSAVYDGTGVCDQYQPAGQTLFAASSGTSHSAPAVAGIASLYYRWLQINAGFATPSPALIKAYMLAHPTYLTGVSANDTLPSNSQGFGMPDMKTAFDNTTRALVDQSHVFTSTGQTWTWAGSVADTTKPLRIVMSYTDAPGAIGTSPQVNNLNLTVVVNGVTYLGNHFAGRWSTTGGTADNANNAEAIFLPATTTGAIAIAITVTAANIAGDGVPNNATPLDQDFALVCYNCKGKPVDNFCWNCLPNRGGWRAILGQ